MGHAEHDSAGGFPATGPRAATVGAGLLALALAVGGCGSDSTQREPAAKRGSAAPTASRSTTATSGPASRAATEADFAVDRFSRSTAVTNPWLPLTPGTQWTVRGSAKEDGKRVTHATVTSVTDLTKVVDGVRTRVVWERDFSDGELVEAELAFFAQDDGGNVWHFGQYPEEYEGGRFVAAPAWLSGLQGARAGIAMRANPRTGTSSYAQGWGPKVNWTDRAYVAATGQRTCVPAGCYRNVLVTAEAARDEPGAHQLKYYAAGVGNVRVGWQGKDEEQETMGLVRAVRLGPAALAAVRAEALKLEKRAYSRSKDVYARTAPSS